MESLAKGAVRFSRKYTLRELTDRWWSLLYDTDVSAQASAAMLNLEHPPPNVPVKAGANGIKESLPDNSAKRKALSIRSQYYEMRKKLCMKMIDSFDEALFDEVNLVGNTGGDDGVCGEDIVMYDEPLAGHCRKGNKVDEDIGLQGTCTVSGKKDNGAPLLPGNVEKGVNNVAVDNLAGYRSCPGLQEGGSSHSLPEPLWKTMEDITTPTMPVHVSLENKDQHVEEQSVLPNQAKGKYASGVSDVANAVPKEEATNLLGCGLEIPDDDLSLIMNMDLKYTPEKDYAQFASLLLDSPTEIQISDAPESRESLKSNKETQLIRSSSNNGSEVANPSDCCHHDLHSASNPCNDKQSPVVKESRHCADLGDEFIHCVLNTEDPEIPNNDDFVPHRLVPSKSQPIHREAGFPVLSSSNQRNVEPVINLKKEGNPLHSFTTSQVVRPTSVANSKSNQQPAGVAMKTDCPGRSQFSAVSRQDHVASVNPSQSRIVHVNTKSAADGLMKEEVKYFKFRILYNYMQTFW